MHTASLIAAVVSALFAQEPRPVEEDRPRVAIIQYESGRVLVVQEVNGQLQAVEPSADHPALLAKYLKATESRRVAHGQDRTYRTPEPEEADGGAPIFFSPGWYHDPAFFNANPPLDNSPNGRAAERMKQNAAEKEQQVIERRKRMGVTGTTNMSGQPFPLTASRLGDQREIERLNGQTGNSPYATFFSLGRGLETYRQRELAARKELALLSYDALMEEGLRHFGERDYGQAARSFIAATQKDHGDAGSRLHAAQALMSQGLHSEAMVHVRRAFELAPGLINRPLNHKSSYTFAADYDDHVIALMDYVGSHPDDADALILLAYQQFFSDHPRNALKAMRQVKPLAQNDRFAWKLTRAAEPLLGRL
jgi:tetratricopeptide (TPR) repeat protein